VYHSTLGLRVIKSRKKKKFGGCGEGRFIITKLGSRDQGVGFEGMRV